jgi:hypothetical protein
MTRWHSVLIPLLVTLIVCAPFPVSADDSAGLDELTTDYFRGLRERRLFRLAESYCLQKLSRGRLSLAVRTDLTIELARTLTEHAMYAGPAEQTELWNQARKTLEDVLEAEPTHPRRILFEVQLALVPAAAGECDRSLAELQPDDPAIARRAADELNEALSRLRILDARIADRLRKGPAARTPADELSTSEWRSLGFRVRQRLGLVQLNLAHLQPAESADRTATLLDAQKLLKPLADTPEDDEFVWTSRLALIECQRLLGEYTRAANAVRTLEGRSPSAEFSDRLIAERVRILMATRKFADATALLTERERRAAVLPAELGFLKARLLAERIEDGVGTAGPGAADEARRALEAQVERLRREAGGYWASRAVLLLEQVRDRAEYGPELAGLVRRGGVEFRAGRLVEAAALFGKASAAARQKGRGDLAFRFAYRRASIEVEARMWGPAAADLRTLVTQFPDHPQAAEAHLLAAYCLGRLYDQEETKSNREELASVLQEHRGRYAGGGSVGEATWLLATLNERTGETIDALKLYREIPREHPRGGAALSAMARCYEVILDRLRQERQPTETWERDAVATLEAALPAANPSTRLDHHEAEAAVRLARILLGCRPPRYSAADGWLVRVQGALASGESASDQSSSGPPALGQPGEKDTSAGGTATDILKSQVLQLRIVSLAGQGKFQEARRQLQQLSVGRPAEMLQVLEGLAPLASSEKPDPFHDLGSLQLEAAQRLDEQRDALDPPLRRRLDECLARGYAASGQTRRAIEAYDLLLKDSPRDKRLLAASGELLLKSTDGASLRQAQKTWRTLETLSPAGSDEWLFARYHHCQSLLALHETAQACKLLKVTRLLYPKLGGKKLEAKFAALEENCRGEK